jgi:hypothetical protein
MRACASTLTRPRVRQDVRDARGRPHVGPATRFVSHAWSYPFADLLAALLARAEAAPHDATAEDEYLWIGTACVLLPARTRMHDANCTSRPPAQTSS